MGSDRYGNVSRVQRVSDLAGIGISPAQLARGRRDGTWSMVRRGAVVEGLLSDDAWTWHRELIDATVPVLAGGNWALSHLSAAVMLGLPLVNEGLGAVWITRPPGQSAHRRKTLVTRVCNIDPDEVVVQDGLRVTCPERTAIDMARQYKFVTGLMVADAVLRAGGGLPRMEELLARGAGRPGNKAARAAVGFANGAVESPGESMMRAHLHRLQCPDPILQFELRTADGRFVSRNDFGWPEWKVVGEYDGMGKYTTLLRPGETTADAIRREKAREAAIRDQGFEIIRFTAEDLRHPERAAERLMRLLRRNGYRVPGRA